MLKSGPAWAALCDVGIRDASETAATTAQVRADNLKIRFTMRSFSDEFHWH
jgi:hypothetical protein